MGWWQRLLNWIEQTDEPPPDDDSIWDEETDDEYMTDEEFYEGPRAYETDWRRI